jgi:hypothetical protein
MLPRESRFAIFDIFFSLFGYELDERGEEWMPEGELGDRGGLGGFFFLAREIREGGLKRNGSLLAGCSLVGRHERVVLLPRGGKPG